MKHFHFEYKAPLVARIGRRIRNKVDLANQRHETFGLIHWTRRKNVRVSIVSFSQHQKFIILGSLEQI